MEFIIGVFAVFGVFVTAVCIFDIPAYFKKFNKPIFEFDTVVDGIKFHVTVLEKHNHHFSCQVFRYVLCEYKDRDDGHPWMYYTFMNEEMYREYLNGMITEDEYENEN